MPEDPTIDGGVLRQASGVRIERISDWALAAVIARRGRTGDVTARAGSSFSIALPDGPRLVRSGKVGFLGLAPGKWLAVATDRTGWEWEERLREVFSDLAAVSDQSDAYLLFRLSGPNARDVLAKGIAIDFHPSAFRPGDAATTSMALVGVTLWQVDGDPAYVLAAARSYEGSFLHHLSVSAAEFGVTGP